MRYLVIIFFVIVCQFVLAQSEANSYKFRIYLKDKPSTDELKADPLSFLSKKAIDRKKAQQAIIDSTDFPLSSSYKEIIRNAGVRIVSQSKWFNTLVIECADSSRVREIERLSFVDSAKFVWQGKANPYFSDMRPRLSAVDCSTESIYDSNLGIASKQFELHKAQYMFNAGFQGKGIDIAAIDAGFTNLDVIPSFAHSIIMGYKNFVPNGDIFSASDHGTRVVSTMALNVPTKIVGSAPQSSYLLLRSEDEQSEFPVEEDYWVAAIEYADSLGIMLVNTSLGYNHFDDSTLNYTNKELTGKKSLISRAVDMAFEKGMLIVGSAGNEGNKPWAKITVPGDAERMLTIGAIALDSTIAPFSSIGPTADGRIKPDLVSIGSETVTVGKDGVVSYKNGTSFSSPFLAGLIGSLWSVNPQLNRTKLIDIVRRSANQFHYPDSVFGFGIPNFEIAFDEVLQTLKQEKNHVSSELVELTVTDNGCLIVTLREPEFNVPEYSLRILNEKGETIVTDIFEADDYTFTLSKQLKKENEELYVVVQSPFKQNVIRLKI